MIMVMKAGAILRAVARRLCRPLRLATASGRALPHFIIIGAQKGGTTALFSYLATHPQVWPSSVKEVHYFNLFHHKGVNWYRSWFPRRQAMERRARRLGRPVVTGEATPCYLFDEEVAERAYRLVPRAKLILLLRDPARRAYSHYRMDRRVGLQEKGFIKALALERRGVEHPADHPLVKSGTARRQRSYIARGIYLPQLIRYEQLFGQEQMLILRSEDLFENPQRVFDEVARFLGLDSWTLVDPHPIFSGGYASARIPGEKWLRKCFEPSNEQLSRHLARDFGW